MSTAELYSAHMSEGRTTTVTPTLMESFAAFQRTVEHFSLLGGTTRDPQLLSDRRRAEVAMSEERRTQLIERLTERSLRDDGFDWDALARVDREGWGIIDSE